MLKTQSTVEELEKAFEERAEKFREDYFKYLRFKSVSTDSQYKEELLKCADWVKEQVEKIGFETQFLEGKGNPVIFGQYDKAGPDKPTLLLYLHYDVQPVDPLEEWESDPFEPVLRDGNIYARGAQDNKGQCSYTLAALATLMERDGAFPLNIKICIEGEEEIGSPGLTALVKEKGDLFKADYLTIVDTFIKSEDQPAIPLGTRGNFSLDVEVFGQKGDLHSGLHGGIVFNPLHALVEMLAKLRDENGKILVPGFYDDVISFSDEELEQIDFDFDAEQYEKEIGARPVGGEKEFSPLESNWLRPCLEINGVCGGYYGEGVKSVIPAKAIAKISGRIVSHQDPEKTAAQVADYLEKISPEGVEVKTTIHPGGGVAVQSSPNAVSVKAISKAYKEIFNKSCIFNMCGATIPIAPDLGKASGAEVLFMGTGLDSDQIHAPNEHFGWERYKKGFIAVIRFIEILAL